MAAATKYSLAPAGSTTNLTGSTVELTNIVEQAQVAFQFVVEAAGATPTVTFKYQGSLDGTNWYDLIYYSDANDTLSVATRVVTAVGASVQWLDTGNGSRLYRYYRVVTTADTNVTYRAELYAFNIPR